MSEKAENHTFSSKKYDFLISRKNYLYICYIIFMSNFK